MRTLIMGGPRHGEWVETIEGVRTWLDIVRAETYVIRAITWVAAPSDGGDGSSWRVSIAVHPSLTGLPTGVEQEQVQAALFRMTMTHWMAEFGTPTDIEPPASPAALFAPDGHPIATTVHEPPADERG
jgi:hypothetical protein